MPVIGVHHSGRTVQDMERVLPFYRDTLGLLVVDDDILRGEDISHLVGIQDAILRAVMLSVDGDQPFLELLQYLQPESRPLSGGEMASDVGNAHFCVLVDDIHAEHARLVEAGIRFTAPPIETDAGRFKGERVAFCYDPEGQIVELWSRGRV